MRRHKMSFILLAYRPGDGPRIGSGGANYAGCWIWTSENNLPRTPVNSLLGTLAASHPPYRCEHPLGGIQLIDHPVRSGLDRILRMDHLHGRADHKDPSARVHPPQSAYELEAVPIWQPAVEESNVHAFKHRAGFGQRTRLTHHLQIRLPLQQADEGNPEVDVVVHH